MVKAKSFVVSENEYKFYMERWAEWATTASYGKNISYPHASAFMNTRVDNDGRNGARILIADNPDMERIEVWVSHLSEMDPIAAEAVRARWEARHLYFERKLDEKAFLANAVLLEKELVTKNVSLTKFKSRLLLGNSVIRFIMARERFKPRFSRDDVYG